MAKPSMKPEFEALLATVGPAEAILAFVARVNARAEADMLAGNPITGAHHRALEAEAELLRTTVEAK